KKILSFENGLHAHLKDKHVALLTKLESDKAMDKDAEAQMAAAIAEFKKTGTY
ncbi:MAG: F0F1 ATP synthase subunit alpha, partial [Hydrogenophaga sp.]|nr:F0F1 ATP synthase subunit alpha [Hydrogenophaga sp.]